MDAVVHTFLALKQQQTQPQRSVRLDQTALDTIEQKQIPNDFHPAGREPSESSWCQSSVGSASCSEGTTGSQEDVKQFLGLETRAKKKKKRRASKKSPAESSEKQKVLDDNGESSSTSDESEGMDLEALETANKAESAKKSIASIIRNARHARGSILMAKPDYRQRLTEWRRLEAEQNILNPDPEDQVIQGEQTYTATRSNSIVSSQLAAIGLLDEPRSTDVGPPPQSPLPVSSPRAANGVHDDTSKPAERHLSPEKKAISVFLSLFQDTSQDTRALSDQERTVADTGNSDATTKRSVSAERRSATNAQVRRTPSWKRHERKSAPPKMKDEPTAFSIGYQEREKRRQSNENPPLEQPTTVNCMVSSGNQAPSPNTAEVSHATSSNSKLGAHDVSVKQQNQPKSVSPEQSDQQHKATEAARLSVEKASRRTAAPSLPMAVEEPQPKLAPELPQRKLATELSQRKLTMEPSQRKLTMEPSQRKLTMEPSQRKLTKEPSQRKLTKEPSQRKLATILPVVIQEDVKVEPRVESSNTAVSQKCVKPKKNKTGRKRKQTKLRTPLPPRSSSAPATEQAAQDAQTAASTLPKTFWDNVLVQDNNSVATEGTRGELGSFDSAASVRNTTFVKEWGNLLSDPRHKVQIPAKIEEQADFVHDGLPQPLRHHPPAPRSEALSRPQKVPIATSHFDMMAAEHNIAKPSRTSSPPRPPNNILYPSLAAPHVSTPALEPVFLAQRIPSPRVPETTKDEEARDNYVRAMVRHRLIRRITPAAPGAFARKFGAEKAPGRRKRDDADVADRPSDGEQPAIPEEATPDPPCTSSYYLVWKYRSPLPLPGEPRSITLLPTYIPRKPPSSAPSSPPRCKTAPRPKSQARSSSATIRTGAEATSEHAMRAFTTLAEAAARRALEHIRARQTKLRIAKAARRLGVVPGIPASSPPSRPPLTSLVPMRPIKLTKIATTVPRPFELSQSPRFDAESMRKQQEVLWLAQHECYSSADGYIPVDSPSDDSSLRATSAQTHTPRRHIHSAGRPLDHNNTSCLIHLDLHRPKTQPMSPTRITMPSDYIDEEAKQGPASERSRPERLSTAQLTRNEAENMDLPPLVDPLLGQKGWPFIVPPTSRTEPAVIIVGAAKTFNEVLRRNVVDDATVCVAYVAETGLETIQAFANLAVLRVSIRVIFLGDVADLSREDLAFGLDTVAQATALRDNAPMIVGFGPELVHEERVQQEGVHQPTSLLDDFLALNDKHHLVTILDKALSRTFPANQPGSDISQNNNMTPNMVPGTAVSQSTARKARPARVHIDAHNQRANAPALT